MRIVKWAGMLLGIVALLFLAGAGLAWRKSSQVISRRWDVRVQPVAIPADPASIARGRHLAEAVSKCVDCHGADLAGRNFLDEPPFVVLYSANLTSGAGGIGATYGDVDWVRAVRHGLRRDSTALAVMPALAYQHLSDADLGAIIAYVRSVPPVDNAWPAPAFGPVARMLLARGELALFEAAEVDHGGGGFSYPTPDTTVQYGRYLADIGGCTYCHNPAMSGGPVAFLPPGSPPAANLTPGGMPVWSEAEFVRSLREGKTRDGRDIDDEVMPWRQSGRMTDAEIRAVWLFLRSLPARGLGER